THPTYRPLAALPLAERVARLREPDVRARLLAERPATENTIAIALITRWDQIFPLGDPPDYEPAPETSAAAAAEREGRTPDEVVLDWLLERNGEALLFAPQIGRSSCRKGCVYWISRLNSRPTSMIRHLA